MHNESGKWELNTRTRFLFLFLFVGICIFFIIRYYSFFQGIFLTYYFPLHPLYRLKFINKFARRFNLSSLEKKLSTIDNKHYWSINRKSPFNDLDITRSRSRQIHELTGVPSITTERRPSKQWHRPPSVQLFLIDSRGGKSRVRIDGTPHLFQVLV